MTSGHDSEPQSRLDAALPTFLTAEQPDGCRGMRWVADADLAALPTTRESADRQEALLIAGTWPPMTFGEREVAVLVPAGTVARFVGTSYTLLGFGYLAAFWLDLIVEGGPLDGRVLAVNDQDRWLVSGSVSHRTAALCHLVPA